jgi:hypothetical protein
MRRLTQRNDDRGASAVLFALCLVVLVGFVGLGVDVTASYAKDQEMQHAADAAALAVAQECAKQETCAPANYTALAEEYAVGNAIDGVTPVHATPSSGSQPSSVRVVTESTRQNWFLPLFGLDETAVGAEATAIWGTPTGGIAVLPMIFSVCNFEAAGGPSGNYTVLQFPKHNDDCEWGQDGNVMPAGFAYIGDGSTCKPKITVDGWIESAPGNSPPSQCSASYFETLKDETVLLPIFDACRRRSGSNNENNAACPVTPGASQHGDYHVHAFAAFKIESYMLGGQYKTSPEPCSGSARCIAGRFVEYVSIDDSFEYGTAPDTGTHVVALID